MRLGVILAACWATCLLLSTRGTAAVRPVAIPAVAASPAGALISPSPPHSEPLVLDGISVEPRWDHTTEVSAGQPVTLAIELRLSDVPENWVQVSAGMPPQWRATGQREGWTSWYFLPNSRIIRFEMELTELEQTSGVGEFPLLVQTGERTGWLRLYLQKTDHGFCTAITRVDERGLPRWFRGESTDGSDRAYWSLRATVSEALEFVGEVLEVDIHPPSYLSPWCGVGMRSSAPQRLIEVICSHAGCVVERMSAGEYLLDFARGYTGEPDASWFVLVEGDRVRLSAGRGVAADVLVPALLEAVGARLMPSPDLSRSTVYCSWSGSFRGALEALCEGAAPSLTWKENEQGQYVFTHRDGPGGAEAVRSP